MGSSDTIGILGLGVNNRPLVPFLRDMGHPLIIYDRRSASSIEEDLVAMGLSQGIKICGGEGYLEALRESDIDTLYVTPGIKKYGPPFDQLVERGVKLTSETDLFLSVCPAPVIGITGSAGKTTTTTLVGETLKRDGRRPVFVGGNIGQPLLPTLGEMTPDSWVVMELSSFQLDLVERSPHGAALLNISPNHLDVHRDYADYKMAKANILRYQSKEDWAVLPYRDAEIENLVPWYQGRPVFFSLHQEIPHGAYYHDGKLWWRGGNGARPVVDRHAFHLLGDHNVANALATIAIVASSGADLDACREVLEDFRGVPHRLEVVRQLNGVTYINDSIATAPDRTMAALRAIQQPIVLILGGYDKKLNYDTLGKALSESSVRTVVAMGAIRETMVSIARQYTACEVLSAEDFDDAVLTAHQVAREGDVVLLAPAAASYDMFKNFEDRGKRFREIVGMLDTKSRE